MTKRIVLIGNGVWAQKYISTFDSFPYIQLQIANRYNWQTLINTLPDGVIVCTSPSSHIDIACYSLNRGIATLIEKPLALTLTDALRLQQFKTSLLVNHIHLFSSAYQEVKTSINSNHIQSIVTKGYNRGPTRSDCSSLFDYGSHDIAQILDITQQLPKYILCHKYDTEYGNLYIVELEFNTFRSMSIVGNGAAIKARKLIAKCKSDKSSIEKTFVYNDTMNVSNDINITSPLYNVINVFINAIDGKKDYRLGLELSLDVINILEKCEKSIDAANYIKF